MLSARPVDRSEKLMNAMPIVKVGETLPSLRATRGDFEHWILSGMQLDLERSLVVDVRNGGRLPEVDQLSGVVITGSHAMVTEHQAWSERTAEWLTQAVERGVPVLGICYGHQLLAEATGVVPEDATNELARSMTLKVCRVYVTFDQAGDNLLSLGFSDIVTDSPAGFYQHWAVELIRKIMGTSRKLARAQVHFLGQVDHPA